MAVTTFSITDIHLNSFLTAQLAVDKGWNLEMMGEALEETGEMAGLPRDWSEAEIFAHKQEFVKCKFKEHIEAFASETIVRAMQMKALEAQKQLDEELEQRKLEIQQTLKIVEEKTASNIKNSFDVQTK